MTRQEHVQWCKDRAMEYVEAGDLEQAFASMCSDLGKHDETRDHPGIMLGMMGMTSGLYSSEAETTRWIQGFN